MSDTIENPDLETPEIKVGAAGSGEAVDELEAAFEAFNQNNSEHKPEEQTSDSNEIDPTEIDLNQAENFKLQIFMSLMFALLDGLHVFIYNFMSKYKLTTDDIGLDENDREGLQMYFKTQRVMDLINRLPVEVMGFIHIEWLYFQKFRDFKKAKELEEPEEEEEETEEEETEEEEEETPDQKIERIMRKKAEEFAAKKKAEEEAAKKKTTKKAAPKKAAPKKAEVKKPVKKAAPKKAAKKAATKTTEEKK